MKNNLNKKELIDLVESFSKKFFIFILILSFFFGNLFVIIVFFYRIFFNEKYNSFLNLIKDLKDEDFERQKQLKNKKESNVEDNDDENEFLEDDYEFEENDEINNFEINENDDEYEDDKREMHLYSYIKWISIISYFSYGITIFSTLSIFFPNNSLILLSFFVYCILYNQLFKIFFGYNLKNS